MKKYLIITVTFLLCFHFIKAQTFLNQACNWPPYSPNGVLRAGNDRDKTSEDWWYDVKAIPITHPAYDANARFVGCGYSGFDEPIVTLSNYYSNDPCFNYVGNDETTNGENCKFELKDMKLLNLTGTIGLFNLTVTSSPSNPYKWIYNYGNGTLFRKVTPTADSGFLAVGYSFALKVPGPLPAVGSGLYREEQFSTLANTYISYQAPGSAATFNNFTYNTGGLCNNIPFNTEDVSQPSGYNPSTNPAKHRHACLVKVDKDGKLLWYYKYGIEPFTSSDNGSAAYWNGSFGNDVVEVSDGYIMVGGLSNRSYCGNYGSRGFIAKVNTSGVLQWIKRYPDVPGTSTTPGTDAASRFLGVKTLKIGSIVYAYVVGEKTTNRSTGFSASPLSSWYWNGASDPYFFSSTQRMEPFLKKIDISSVPGSGLGQEVWSLSLQINSILNHRVNSVSIDTGGKIIVPVLSDCKLKFGNGECQNSQVYRVTDLGASVSSSLLNDFGPMRAFDLQMSAMATSDGGYSVVSTKKPYNLTIDKNYTISPFDTGFDMSGCSNSVFSQTDAFVAKCNSGGTIEWTTIFDNQSLSGGIDGGGNALSPFTTIGNPRNEANLDDWMNKQQNRSRKDIKRQECVYAITTSQDGNIILAGNMSANIDDNYSALVQNNCQLDMSYHLFQSIPGYANPSVNLNNVNDLIASQITTGRKPDNINEVAEFVVNSNAKLNITAGQTVDLYEGTDIGFANSITTPAATADADVDISINSAHTCISGAVYEYTVPKGTGSGMAGRAMIASNISSSSNAKTVSSLLYPNPTSGNFTIDISTAPEGEFYVVILDMAGRKLKTFSIQKAGPGSSRFNFNVSGLSAGSYIFRISGNKYSKQAIMIIK